MKYLRRVEKARFLWRDGSVLTYNLEALRQEMEKVNVGQRQEIKIVAGYYNCGFAYPSRIQRGGDREARRKRQRAK